ADPAATGSNSATGSPDGASGSGSGAVLALASGSSSSSGTFTATSLLPAFGWAAGSPSGDFTYSYPLRVPPSLGGPSPQLSFDYSSGSVDGRTLATNSQPSVLGEGWELSRSYI